MRHRRKRNRLPERRGAIILLLGIGMLLISSGACHYYNLELKLDAGNREWLNKVRYIITSKEWKMFLDLPMDERDLFKEEFWARRDPDPKTEENEFKIEYYNRVEMADKIFVSESRPGWMTDRGRIYILFGPPMDRITYDQNYMGRCQEVWYYGQFPVVFVDNTCTGQYQLITYDLTSLRSFNLMYMQELSKAQAQAQQTIQDQESFFNFTWKVRAGLVNNSRIEGTVSIEVPLAYVWFREENGMMKTELDLRLEIKNTEEQLVWEFEQTYDVEISEEELTAKRKRKYEIEIPLLIEKDIEWLQKGRNLIYAILTNLTGSTRVRKVLAFKFGS